MEDPKAFDVNGSQPQRIARELLPYLASKMSWSDSELILDFGSGPGYVTKNVLKPLVDNNSSNSTIYGWDISPKMVQFASANYAETNIIYNAVDIVKSVDTEFHGKFHKIFSAFTLMWIQDEKKALGRLYDLLKVNGDLGVYFASSAQTFSMFNRMAKMQKWAQYFNEENTFTPPQTQDDADPVTSTRKMLEEIGFTVEECTASDQSYKFDTFDKFIEFILSIDPHISRIPTNMLTEYKIDFREESRKVVKTNATSSSPSGVEVFFVLMIVRARKAA